VRQNNGLAKALSEIDRIERTLFILDRFRDPALRWRVQTGLNKGEFCYALKRAVFMHRLGEIRDRKSELSGQWADSADGGNLAAEYRVSGNGGRCREA
jgi:TnpA family transposase